MQKHFDEVHSPDIFFQRTCDENFGINRGVYNTIDNWFYNIGLKNILVRRKEILRFLFYLSGETNVNQKPKIKFGNGGLSKELNEYWIKYHLVSENYVNSIRE